MDQRSGVAARIGPAIVGAAYIRMNADRLEEDIAIFDSFDMAMGGFYGRCVAADVDSLGSDADNHRSAGDRLLFLRPHIDHPLFSHPAYEPAFVMNYIGLGVTQGFFLFAQTASDDIFFLVIYATTLFGLGMMPMIVEAGRLVGGRGRRCRPCDHR